MTIRPSNESDLRAVRQMLETEKLPVDIIDDRKGELWIVEEDGDVRGAGALEIYGDDALLRSLVISDEAKGNGYGKRMVGFLEEEARARNVSTVWLLTETAEAFFPKLGYEIIDRSVIVNKGLLDSAEFKHLCSTKAVCMRKILGYSESKGEM